MSEKHNDSNISDEDAVYAWLHCTNCGGTWENCLLCPGVQQKPFICISCQGGDGIFAHHRYCPTQHVDCSVNANDKNSCWWCRVHA